ncbi:MAG: hypothetical protein EOM43_02065 [Gammaproteobacteria bacterium]|nr:hypothetical protein [Gammaproteobacteria bacterium]
MADLTLTSIREELEQKTAPFTIEFGTPEKPREVGFNHLLTVESKTRVQFYELLSNALTVTTEEAEENPDVYIVFANKIKTTLSVLATNKTDFNALAKFVGDDYMLWDSILGKYTEHFKVKPGE